MKTAYFLLATAAFFAGPPWVQAVRLASEDAAEGESATNAFLRSRAEKLLSLLRQPGENGTQQARNELIRANIRDFRGVIEGNLTDDALAPALVQSASHAVSTVNRRNFYNVALGSVSHHKVRRMPQRRVAVLVAMKYNKMMGQLPGTIYDVLNVWKTLTQDRGFKPEDITVCYDHKLTGMFEDKFTGSDIRIKLNSEWDSDALMEVLYEKSKGLREGDFFVFHYSGHGGQVPDSSGKELDGKAEALNLPSDNLRDTEFYPFLCHFAQGVQVTLIVDACHSQGFSNLPYNYNPGKAVEDADAIEFKPDRTWCCDWVEKQDELPKATIRYFSGSQNKQTSADLGHNGGAFTRHLIDVWMGQAGFETHRAIQGNAGSMFNRFKRMLITFKEGMVVKGRGGDTVQKIEQEPNFNAWPTVNDDELFDLWAGTLNHARAVGGKQSGANARMVAPPRCQEKPDSPKLAIFDDADMDPMDTGIQVDPAMASAQSQGSVLEGWIASESALKFDQQGVVAVVGDSFEPSQPTPAEESKPLMKKPEIPKSNVAKMAAQSAVKVPPNWETPFSNIKRRFPAAEDELIISLIIKADNNLGTAGTVVSELRRQGYEEGAQANAADSDDDDDEISAASLGPGDDDDVIPVVSPECQEKFTNVAKRFKDTSKKLIAMILEENGCNVKATVVRLENEGHHDSAWDVM